MITTVHVAISWPKDKPLPILSTVPLEYLSIRDPRVLLGVQQVLARRAGVIQAPDLVSARQTGPYFAVSLDDTAYNQTTPLLTELTAPIRLQICYAEGGGWKVVLVDLDVKVI